MALYRALQRGYDNVKIREPGEEFEFEGVPGEWMELVDDEEATKAKPKAKVQQPKPGSSSNADVI